MKSTKKIGMFNALASGSQMYARNYILGFIRIVLWATMIISCGRIFIRNLFSFDWPSDAHGIAWYWYLTASISVVLLIRFEFWVTDWWAHNRCATGKEWSTSWYGAYEKNQKKFFTCKNHYYHHNDDRQLNTNNPLW